MHSIGKKFIKYIASSFPNFSKSSQSHVFSALGAHPTSGHISTLKSLCQLRDTAVDKPDKTHLHGADILTWSGLCLCHPTERTRVTSKWPLLTPKPPWHSLWWLCNVSHIWLSVPWNVLFLIYKTRHSWFLSCPSGTVLTVLSHCPPDTSSLYVCLRVNSSQSQASRQDLAPYSQLPAPHQHLRTNALDKNPHFSRYPFQLSSLMPQVSSVSPSPLNKYSVSTYPVPVVRCWSGQTR